MTEAEILDLALENVAPYLTRRGKWTECRHLNFDARVTLQFPEVGSHEFPTEVKYEIREPMIRMLKHLKEEFPDFLLVAFKIYPKYRQYLQDIGINGNLFIRKNGTFILVDKFPSLKEEIEESNRAFTKTGLKVFFQLLVDDNNLFVSQRQIAEKAGVALGNIPLVIKGLTTMGLLLKRNGLSYQWNNKQKAIDYWVNGYRTTLKASLLQGRYLFPHEMDWRDLNLPTSKTLWGGEPGADLLTNHLRPEKLTLFTDLKKNDFIKATRFKPDSKGDLEVYSTFWDGGNEVQKCAPPLLVYADLIINGDKRSLETAGIIYEKHLQEL
jgi:hypothetical protein